MNTLSSICRPFSPTELQLKACTAAADKLNVGIAIIDSHGCIFFGTNGLKRNLACVAMRRVIMIF